MAVSFSDFRLSEGVPIYLQIIRYLKAAVSAGTVRDGDEMPSRRVLSALLGVNPNTIQKAYRQLEDEGLIRSHAGAKSFVSAGAARTEALRQELLELNPYLQITADCVKVDEENLRQPFVEDEIICEAFDRAEQKALLVNGILEHFPEKKLIAASGMAGSGDSNRIRTRKIAGNFYLCGDGESESLPGMGLMAPRVALCAAHEANAAVSLILGKEPC